MTVQALTDELAVAGQITATDIADIAAQGFRSIICNRPDGEAPGQPTFAEVAKAAAVAGLAIRHIPVIPGHMTEADADAMRAALADMRKPVLAYCRTGTRSANLYSLAKARR